MGSATALSLVTSSSPIGWILAGGAAGAAVGTLDEFLVSNGYTEKYWANWAMIGLNFVNTFTPLLLRGGIGASYPKIATALASVAGAAGGIFAISEYAEYVKPYVYPATTTAISAYTFGYPGLAIGMITNIADNFLMEEYKADSHYLTNTVIFNALGYNALPQSLWGYIPDNRRK